MTSNTPYAEIVKRLKDESDDPYFDVSQYPGTIEWIKRNWALREEAARAIEALEADADRSVEEERAACARIADVYATTDVIGWSQGDNIAGRIRVGEVASAIRSRSNATTAPSPVGFSDEEVLVNLIISVGMLRRDVAKDIARAVLTHLRAQNEDGLTAPATGRSPISQEGSIAPEALSEEVICTVDSAEFLVDGEIDDDDDRQPGVYLTLHTPEAIGIKAGQVAIRFLSASPSPPALQGVGGGWQPMSSAPTDGSVVLVYRPDAGGAFTAWHTNPGFALGLPDDEWTDDEWWSTSGTDLQGELMPTHWMPLPSPPPCTAERGAVSGQDSNTGDCALEPTGAGASLSDDVHADGTSAATVEKVTQPE